MRFFTRLFLGMRQKDEDDEEEEGESRINYQNRNISSSGIRLPMLFVLGGITIYNKSVKGLFWEFISISSHAKPPYPLLPLHNPPTTQPLLPLTISSHPCAFDENDDDDDDDDEDDRVLLCREENRSVQTDHHVACASTSKEEEEEEYRTHPSLSLQNPTTSTSTITESLLLYTPSPTTLDDDDDDDRHSSPTIFDGDDRHSMSEDRDLWCQEEIYWYRTIDHHVVASDMMPAFVEENEIIPFLSKEENKKKWMKRQKYKEKEKEKEEVEEETKEEEEKKMKKKERKMKGQKYKEKWKETEEVEVEVEVEVEEETEEEEEKTKEKRKRKKKMKKEMMKEKSLIVEVEEIWIKHYSSRHRILLVGEGNFSFSACLAKAFGCASNIIATSLDSEAFLKENYEKALSNIEELKSRGSKVVHGIDATTMANHPLLRQLKFDRIVFNFPYAGLQTIKNLPRQTQLEHHRRLVSQFVENARELVSEKGEIHITHKTNGFHADWSVESIASGRGLRLIEAVDFELHGYPGYDTKCGFGGNNYFYCYPSLTYKFGLPSQS